MGDKTWQESPPPVAAALLGCGLSCHVLSPIPCFHSGRAPELLAELEVDVLDELLVQLELFLDKSRKFARSAGRGLDSLHAEPGDDLGAFRGLGDGRVQFGDDA